LSRYNAAPELGCGYAAARVHHAHRQRGGVADHSGAQQQAIPVYLDSSPVDAAGPYVDGRIANDKICKNFEGALDTPD
jgi:hypothetical protein